MPRNPNAIYSRASGDLAAGSLIGLSRLSPYVYVGDGRATSNTIDNYFDRPDLRQWRAQVGELTPNNGTLAYPESILDIDSRSLYFGHQIGEFGVKSNVFPKTLVGEHQAAAPEGRCLKGLPIAFRQVHVRAYTPGRESDEYVMILPVSRLTTGFGAVSSEEDGIPTKDLMDSDYKVHNSPKQGEWTNNDWQFQANGREGAAVSNFADRLVIGDPITVKTIEADYKYLYYDNDYPALSPDPKFNTYRFDIDTGSLIVRQNAETETAPGFGYQMPMDAVIAARAKFNTGFWSGDVTATGVQIPDHIHIEYYDDKNIHYEDNVLRRIKPFAGAVIHATDNGENWEARAIDSSSVGGDGEVLDFNFKVTLDGTTISIADGRANVLNQEVSFENIANLTHANNDVWVNLWLGITRSDSTISEITTFGVLGESAIGNTQPNGGSIWKYPLAYISPQGAVTQYQMGDLYDRNLPDITDWPALAGALYDLLQIGTDLGGGVGKAKIDTLREQP